MTNCILTIDLITKDAIKMFKNSNKFIKNCNYDEMPQLEFSTKEIIVLGAAAIMANNPIVSRRFWSWSQ